MFFCLFLFLETNSSVAAQTLSILAASPNWSQLNKYQYTITCQQFSSLLNGIYAPYGHWDEWITVTPHHAKVITHPGCRPFVLHFASDQKNARSVPKTWKVRSQLCQRTGSKPLAGLHITLDPGHLGGNWATMEERCLLVKRKILVKEGDMTLRVARILAPRLRTLGATVTLTRSSPEPATTLRPRHFRAFAISDLRAQRKAITPAAIQRKSEQLFYRVFEIRHRARMINDRFRPDIVICLHFNAESCGSERNLQLTSKNHLHFLVNGVLSKRELAREDQRFDMLFRLLSRTSAEEILLANTMARPLAQTTGLPPYTYMSSVAKRISPYVWARNLLATRIFRCPVIFVEAYVMNNPKVIARVQTGSYADIRHLYSTLGRLSIYHEYAKGITKGLIQYYSPPARYN
ncbi:N-acetylmuramoyl-L-alanine amidase [Candidatus Xiphinematobacter sp. Idaho Grape]|uniref:N-acetylmuramoyl-L-alanine amidase n=1 Tax=Candidatus Xiphinematobacter sp. Idaho Grape TaxID=1704307 RepID=UPI00130EE87A|nr:N-acetylmuramoyl-L-alanine amidase [Candidatus Xiphinematobacter sp. Idaho Grape]